MTREQKIEMIKGMDMEKLIEQLIRSAEFHGVADERYGFADVRTIELSEQIELIKDEMMSRMAM